MRAWWLIGVAAGFGSIGCSGGETDTSGDADTDVDVDSEWDFLDGLQDKEGCQRYIDSDGVEHTDVEGATSFFRGNLGVDSDGNVDGFEYWVLLPNAAWTQASGAQDCALVWHVIGGTSSDLGGCGTCDLALELHAELDGSQTDCIDDFVNYQKADGLGSFDEGYSIKELGSSSAITWYFPSGTEFASGEKKGNVYSYTTDAACKWF